MKKAIKKAVSVLLVAVMIFGAAPLAGFVGIELPEFNLFSTKAEAATYSGICGEKLTWTLDESTGKLTISGTGDMYDWSSFSNVPWYSYISSIKSVIISDGVTSIGESAFYWCTSLASITIPDSVTSIGESAFYWCTSLASVTIPDSVTSIGDYAFSFCFGLTSVKISNSITTIGISVFDSCESLASITIPDGVTSIGNNAFLDCDSLTIVTIPDSVTSIGYRAFFLCDKIASITIPDSVTSIGEGAFCCVVITNITVDENNENYSNDEYGVLFNKDKTILVQYPKGNERTSYTIPDSVTGIYEDAFFGCDNLVSVTIPDSVTNIGSYAFDGCGDIADVYYGGTEEDWNKISIGTSNAPLLNANIHFNHIHTVSTVKESVAATCDKSGYKTGECICGYSLTEEIPALNHKDTLIKVGAKAPTCTEIGWDAYEYCTACTYTTYAEKVTLKHDIVVDKAVEATCTETGLAEGRHCSRCDDATVEQKETPVLGHTESDAVVENNSDAKCGQAGSYDSVVYCSACGEEISRETITVDALEHQYDEVVTAPTCTEIGYTTYTCSLCGDYYVSDEVEELGHDIIIDEAVDATCTETGLTEGQHCSRCDDVTIKQEVVPELDHDIVIDEAVDATCTETGLTKGQHCSRCDDMTVNPEVIPVKPHNHTAKYDSAKHWKECACGSIIDEQNHSFVGGNDCSCGFKRTVNSAIKIKNNNGSKTINYGETLKLTANVTNKPSNAKIYWYIDGEKKGEGDVFNVKFESGTKIITVKLVDSNGVVYQNASGDEITDSENVTVNGGFFQKIISFFKNLFGMNRTVVQVFKVIY